MNTNNKLSNEAHSEPLQQYNVVRSFVNIKLKREDVKDMISMYEYLSWQNDGDERKFCKKILKALKKSLE